MLLFDVISDGVVTFDDSGCIRDCNRAFHEGLGYDKAELVGQPLTQLCPSELAVGVREQLARVQTDAHAHLETTFRRKDDDPVAVEVDLRLAEIFGATLVLGVVRHVPAQVAESALAERDNELAAIMDASPIIIFSKDEDGRFIRVNRVFAQALQMQPEAFVGKTVFDLYSSEIAEAMTRDDRDVIDLGRAKLNIVEEYEAKDGRRWVKTDKVPTYDAEGNITGLVGFAQDITELKLAEEKLRQSQKMEALGTLVGGIAHDFNNMLGGIAGNLFLLRSSVPDDDPDVAEKFEHIERLTFRAADMIKQLLTFARKGRLELQPLNLLSFLREFSKLSKVTLQENIHFEIALGNTEMTIKGDPTQLQQALINLMNNAKDAVAGVPNPHIVLRLEDFEADEHFRQRHRTTTEQHFARLSVEDNGTGIDDDVRGHVFEPFFTTKDVGSGTGLGLSMVYGAIESHGGLIEVESEPGAGAAFRIYLPLLHEEASEHEEAVTPVRGAGETILFVDDNTDIRTSLAEALKSLDYRVLQARDGLEALERFSDVHGCIDLVIMDVVMPRLGGVKAAEQIRLIDPDVKIIFTTGYDKDKALTRESLPDDQIILSKPCDIATLSRVIRAELEAKTSRLE